MKAEDFFDLYQSLSGSIDTKKKTYKEVVERVQDLYLFQYGTSSQKVYSKIKELIQNSANKLQKNVKITIDKNDYIFEAQSYLSILPVLELVVNRLISYTVETEEERKLRKKDIFCNFSLTSTKNMGALSIRICWDGSGLELPGLEDFQEEFISQQVRVKTKNSPGSQNSIEFIFPVIKKMCRFLKISTQPGNYYLLPEWSIEEISKNILKVAIGTKIKNIQFYEISWIDGATLVEVSPELSSAGMVYGLCRIEDDNSVGVVMNPEYLCGDMYE